MVSHFRQPTYISLKISETKRYPISDFREEMMRAAEKSREDFKWGECM